MPKSKQLRRIVLLAILASPCIQPASAEEVIDPNTEELLSVLQNVSPGDEKIAEWSLAAQKLQNTFSDPMIAVTAMDGATPLGKNWLSGVASAIKSRSAVSDDRLMEFLRDSTHAAEARYLVFQWLTEGDEQLKKELLEQSLDDASPEIRFEAIEQAIERLDGQDLDKVREVLSYARHPDQVVALLDRLRDAGEEVDNADHFGFIKPWEVIGPFDNTDQASFNEVFAVEKELIGNSFAPDATHEGKNGRVGWKSVSGDSTEGVVNLAEAYDNEKAAVVYATTLFNADQDLAAQIRLGCINAAKVWLNGQLVMENEVYHAGMQIDQYIADVQLRPGPNRIVVKCLQNEQTESWAQRFQFQLRVCDATGLAIHSAAP